VTPSRRQILRRMHWRDRMPEGEREGGREGDREGETEDGVYQ